MKISKLRAECDGILDKIQDIRTQIEAIGERINRYRRIRLDIISRHMVNNGFGYCTGCGDFLPVKDIKVLAWKREGEENRGNYCERCLGAMTQQLRKHNPEVVDEKPFFNARNFPEKIFELMGKNFPTDIDWPEFK